MGFDLGRFFEDIFAPVPEDVVTLFYDVPHGDLADTADWRDRRALAEEWRAELARLAERFGMAVNPCVIYAATGCNNGDLPDDGIMAHAPVALADVLAPTTIALVMPEYSATAPFVRFAAAFPRLRVGSMPGVARSMQATALAADYREVARRCALLAPRFDAAVRADVTFSTGHACTFDLSVPGRHAHRDDGFLHAVVAGTDRALSNLPAGEVYIVPNEGPDSQTRGELPVMLGDELCVLRVAANRVTAVDGPGPRAHELRARFAADPARCNIAEFAIGCNDRAVVCGRVLEDEKAGFHWANGRSEHLGGDVGVSSFVSPATVEHRDWVYARESPIVCATLTFVSSDGRREVVIRDGDLLV